MAASKRINENYVHSCGLPQVEIVKKIAAISEMGFTSNQVIDVIDFYLFSAPVLKSDKKGNAFGLKSLREYGWCGTSALTKLEGQLLKAARISIFCFIKSDSIDGTLESMNLWEKSAQIIPEQY